MFPNIGVHKTYGGVLFKAGSGWAISDGNVDSFTIGIKGVGDTTYDFEPPNNPPVITSFTASPPSPQIAGTVVTLTVTASDFDNDPLEYRFSTDGGTGWTSWSSSNSYVWSTTAADRGVHTLRAQIRDGVNPPVDSPDISYK